MKNWQKLLAASLTLSSIAAAPQTKPVVRQPAAPQSRPAAVAAPGALLSAEQTQKVDAVIAAALKAGFPDARNATVYSGPISVNATFDPSKEPPPLPSDASSMQMTKPGSTEMEYGYRFGGGLHLKLADGSWIIACRFHFHPRAADRVDVTMTTKIDVATITQDAVAKFPFDSSKKMTQWLAKEPDALRPLAIQTIDRVAPILQYLQMGGEDMAPAAILLHSAGWRGAEELSLAIADQRARNYWQLHLWTTPDSPYDPTGAYPSSQDEEKKWHESQKSYAPEAPDVALRRALFRWSRAQLGQMDPEDAMFPIDTAAAIAKAMVDPGDPQKYAARIDAIAAGMKLPVTPAKDADLPTRLQSWEARPRMPKMIVQGGGAANAPAISTGFVAPVPAYEPDNKDLDALVALLGDERPSRFADFSGPRSIGDNAWRAVAALLKEDPRKLAGYPTDRPWTAQERKAAAAAVQKWWQANRGKYVQK